MAARIDPTRVRPNAALTKRIAARMIREAKPLQREGSFARSFDSREAHAHATHLLGRLCGEDGTIDVTAMGRPRSWGARIVQDELRQHAGVARTKAAATPET